LVAAFVAILGRKTASPAKFTTKDAARSFISARFSDRLLAEVGRPGPGHFARFQRGWGLDIFFL
jgi:hypothetical protein